QCMGRGHVSALSPGEYRHGTPKDARHFTCELTGVLTLAWERLSSGCTRSTVGPRALRGCSTGSTPSSMNTYAQGVWFWSAALSRAHPRILPALAVKIQAHRAYAGTLQGARRRERAQARTARGDRTTERQSA